jgi:hypothetical protein
MVMGEEVPGVTRFAIILPHRPPLALAQVGSPFSPANLFVMCFFQLGGNTVLRPVL